MAEIFLNIKGQLVAEESGQYFIIPAIPIESSDAKRDEKIEPAEVAETVEAEIAVDPAEVALVPKEKDLPYFNRETGELEDVVNDDLNLISDPLELNSDI